jgi:DNA invertase Pin-like site-specific DNA recombinase
MMPRQVSTLDTRRRRAAIYCRVSSRAQAEEDKVSLDDQLAQGEAYCEAEGYEIVFRGRDVMSGATYRRPDFLRMLRLIEDGEIDVVVCWKVDRLGRGMFPIARLLEVCDPTGTDIEAVRERVDRKHLGLLASVGKIELDNIRERTMDARLSYARQGIVPNGITAYGYGVDPDTGKPVVDEAELAILLEGAERYAGGELPSAIVRDFRARRVPTRLPKKVKYQPWTKTYLLHLFSDKAYLTGRRTYGSGDQVVEIPYPPIYSPELWARLVARRETNRLSVRKPSGQPYLLRGLLHCAECQGPCHTSTRRKGRQRVPAAEGGGWRQKFLETPKLAYRCAGMELYDRACRPDRFIDASDVDGRVWTRLWRALHRRDVLLEGLREKVAELEAARPDAADDPQKVLERLAAERINIARERIRGQIEEPILDTLLAENEADAAYWEERAQATAVLNAGAERQRAALDEAIALIEGHLARLGDDPEAVAFADRRRVVLALVERVLIDGQGGLRIQGVLERVPDGAADADRAPVLAQRS